FLHFALISTHQSSLSTAHCFLLLQGKNSQLLLFFEATYLLDLESALDCCPLPHELWSRWWLLAIKVESLWQDLQEDMKDRK
ncbi:hypothetical protein LINPERPRIM_LOCUS19191, partial [Linum perenne]